MVNKWDILILAGIGVGTYYAYSQGYLDSFLPEDWRINKSEDDEQIPGGRYAEILKVTHHQDGFWILPPYEAIIYPNAYLPNITLFRGSQYKLLVEVRNNGNEEKSFIIGYSYYLPGIIQPDGYWLIDVPGHDQWLPFVNIGPHMVKTITIPYTIPNYAILSKDVQNRKYWVALTIRNTDHDIISTLPDIENIFTIN